MQLVVLVLEHSATVSRGIILNRPAYPLISDLLGMRSATVRVSARLCDMSMAQFCASMVLRYSMATWPDMAHMLCRRM